MADVLVEPGVLAPTFWPVDKVCLWFLSGTTVLLALNWSQLPEAPWLLGVHVLSAMLIVLASRDKNPSRQKNAAVWYFRNWYPLPLVSFCYKEMAILIPAVWGRSFDGLLADLDFAIWHANPTVWLERILTPWLTLSLQTIYTLFVPAVLFVPWLLWRKHRYAEFRYCAFLIALGYLVSYVGYLILPARGPRFLIEPLQHYPIDGGWLVEAMRSSLDKMESAHYDCFPSGHAELTIIAWWISRWISPRLGYVYLVYTLCIIFATVYLRYHYTVDLFAAVAVAAVLLAKAPAMYRRLSGGEASIGT